jgi:hypothetical protein
MKLAGDDSHFPNTQHQLWYTIGLLVGQAFTQVETHITNEGINLTDVPALITVLEITFGDADRVARAERKLEGFKQTYCDFSTYFAGFQCYAIADVQ